MPFPKISFSTSITVVWIGGIWTGINHHRCLFPWFCNASILNKADPTFQTTSPDDALNNISCKGTHQTRRVTGRIPGNQAWFRKKILFYAWFELIFGTWKGATVSINYHVVIAILFIYLLYIWISQRNTKTSFIGLLLLFMKIQSRPQFCFEFWVSEMPALLGNLAKKAGAVIIDFWHQA